MIKLFEKFNEPEIKVYYYDNGHKHYESWELNGKQHREDGPAFKEWYKDGQKLSEIWYLNNKLHRENGPAFQTWYPNGQKIYEVWGLNNIEYTREEWVDELGKIGSPHYDEQRMLLDMEKYNL